MKINCVSLATDDLARATEFYKIFLQNPNPETSEDLSVFFFPDKTSLVLYPRHHLESHIKIPSKPSPNEVILTHFCKSKEEVEEVLERAIKAGAKVTDPLAQQPWAYAAVFLDPDNHAWEINYHPNAPM